MAGSRTAAPWIGPLLIPAGDRSAKLRLSRNEARALPDPTQTIVLSAGTVGTIVMGAINWLFKRQVKINDEHDARLNLLETDRVTKDDITKVEAKFDHQLDMLNETIAAGFTENQRTLDAAHRRVDDIYRDMSKRPEG